MDTASGGAIDTKIAEIFIQTDTIFDTWKYLVEVRIWVAENTDKEFEVRSLKFEVGRRPAGVNRATPYPVPASFSRR
jgi:hypothetical protein